MGWDGMGWEYFEGGCSELDWCGILGEGVRECGSMGVIYYNTRQDEMKVRFV
jgi:hypothetical protein